MQCLFVGLVGLVAYVPVGGDLFSVEGGNYKLMNSAMKQAQKIYHDSNCILSRVQRRQKTITTIISSEDSFELLSDDGSLGKFDIVILAAPLQMCRIKFLMHSPMGLDPSILHEMPLTGVHDNVDSDDINTQSQSSRRAHNNEHGGRSFADPLLPSATTPYSEYITNISSTEWCSRSHVSFFLFIQNTSFSCDNNHKQCYTEFFSLWS